MASATVFSSPIRYTACLTEHMARSPWESLAVSRGYAPEDNVITCAMVESPRLHFDDVSTEPQRLLSGIADSMTAPGSWNMWFRSNMVVAMSPQHASLCADAGMSRADVHARLCELAVRPQGDLKRGGNWRPERARGDGRRSGRRRRPDQGGEGPGAPAPHRRGRHRTDHGGVPRLERVERAGAWHVRDVSESE